MGKGDVRESGRSLGGGGGGCLEGKWAESGRGRGWLLGGKVGGV